MTTAPSPSGPVVLGIDTATPQVSVALGGPEGLIATIAVAGGRRHGELLAPAIAELCRLGQTPLSAVTAVAADVGPGLFTGLRVGVSTARALVSALGVPGVGLTSLEVLAGAHRHQSRPVIAVVDARRSEVFWARFEATPDGMAQRSPAEVATPDVVAAVLAGLRQETLVVGDGGRRYREVFSAVPGVEVAGPDDAHPSAVVVVRLALARLAGAAALAGVAGDDLDPLYLRQPEVRIGWASRPDAPAPASGRRADG